jgi:hypothetical protein
MTQNVHGKTIGSEMSKSMSRVLSNIEICECHLLLEAYPNCAHTLIFKWYLLLRIKVTPRLPLAAAEGSRSNL